MQTNKPEILALVKKFAPDPEFARKRRVEIEVSDKVRLSNMNWSGGYKTIYVLAELSTGHSVELPEPDFRTGGSCGEKGLAPGYAMFKYCYRGIRKAVQVVVHPQNMNNEALPVPVELTPQEKVVLFLCRSLKSSYEGIKDYRKHRAMLDYEMSGEDWDSAKADLIERKLLNKRGAITMDGRNAMREMSLPYNSLKKEQK